MAGTTFKNLFGVFYNLYRGEATPPATTDDEWAIALRNYNDALNRAVMMDDTKWNWLFTTLQSSTQSSPALVRTLATSVSTYTAPTDMLEPGAIYTITDSSGGMIDYPIIQPHEVQAMGVNEQYGWFTGNRQAGFIFHISPTPVAADNGKTLDYTYYRQPNYLIASTDDGTVETGTTVVEGCDPSYLYNYMLAQRLKVDENWTGYNTARRDAEEALKNMRLKNNSGNYFRPWTLIDSQGSSWGN